MDGAGGRSSIYPQRLKQWSISSVLDEYRRSLTDSDFRRKNAAKKGGIVKTSGAAKKRKVEKQAEQTENADNVREDMEEETNEDENGTPDD